MVSKVNGDICASPSPPCRRDWSCATSPVAGHRGRSKRLQIQAQIAVSSARTLGGNFVSIRRNQANSSRKCVFPAIFCKNPKEVRCPAEKLWQPIRPQGGEGRGEEGRLGP